MIYKNKKTGELTNTTHILNPILWEKYKVDTAESEFLKAEAIAHYKGLYLGVVQAKLDKLDYDSLATVKLWEGDATFGTEATKILTWYKGIIAKNYALLTAGVPLTDEEYLAEIASVVF